MRSTKKTSSSHRRRVILVVFLLLAALVIGGLAISYALRLWPFGIARTTDVGSPSNGVNYNPPSPDEVAAGENAKQQTATGNAGSDPSPAPTPAPDGTSKAIVGMEITAANVDSSTLHIRTLIQTVTSSGTCTLVATGPNGKSYSATAAVQAGPSTSTCKGFDIPLSTLSDGTWSIRVSFENDSLQASATTERGL